MREILFRAKVADSEYDNEKQLEMIGSFVHFNGFIDLGDNIGYVEQLEDIKGVGWFDIDLETLGQYTGLKDKNGNKIFEGDILRYLDSYDCSNESGYDFEEFLNVGEVIFNKDKARFDITNKSDISYDDWIETVSDCEIIGNIYDNTETLSNKSQ